MTEPPTVPSTEAGKSTPAEKDLHQKIFLFMMLFVVAGALVMGIAGYNNTQKIFDQIYAEEKPAQQEISHLLEHIKAQSGSNQRMDILYTLAAYTALESHTVNARNSHAASLLMTKTWVRLLTTLAATILIWFGAAFVLGRITTASAQLAAGVGSFKGTLATTSPGLILIVLGTGLLAANLWAPWDLKTTDGAAFGPFTVTYGSDNSSSISMGSRTIKVVVPPLEPGKSPVSADTDGSTAASGTTFTIPSPSTQRLPFQQFLDFCQRNPDSCRTPGTHLHQVTPPMPLDR